MLTHASAPVRAHALRALHILGTDDIGAAIQLLRDPSPAVVREATAALRPFTRRVPTSLARQLLADPRVALRGAGYRLLRDRSTAEHLHAALILTTDPDARLARRGLADVTSLARNAARTSWRRTPRLELLVTTAEHTELTQLAHSAAHKLGNNTTQLLTAWLAGHSAHSTNRTPTPQLDKNS